MTMSCHWENSAEGGEAGAEDDEDDGEPEHEERDPEDHAPRLLVLEGGPAQSRDIADVAGHEREHTRRDEGDESGKRCGTGREQQRTGEHRLGEVRPDPTHSASTSSMSPLRVDSSTAPTTRAAARPCASRMTVDGVACGGRTPERRATMSPFESIMFGYGIW